MTSLKETYQKIIVPQLQKELGITNVNAIPRLTKVVVNVGVRQDQKTSEYMKTIENTLARITGQKPVFTKARKSIAAFKIREGMEIGAKVTMHSTKMYDFVTKLIHSTLPRVRDFRGVPESVINSQGNLTLGLKEHIVFPEINPDEIERVHGLSITIVTTAKTQKDGLALFKAMGFPFERKNH